jgi:hypothetical protein
MLPAGIIQADRNRGLKRQQIASGAAGASSAIVAEITSMRGCAL